ncbi:MAG: hypothetical protein IJO63_00700 [Bacilli bacterium]|nr:hypothetical protein [Bacilli bacterium]
MLLGVLAFALETYNVYQTFSIYHDNLIVSVPIKNSDAVINGEYLTIKNQAYKYRVREISDIKYENFQNYQDYIIDVDKKLQNNEVVEITFYYNKQKMIQKIIDIIF